jgi:hypothetical protein
MFKALFRRLFKKPGAAAPAPKPKAPFRDDEHLADIYLRQLLPRGEEEEAALPLHVISLRSYRAALGEEVWGSLRGKIMTLSENVLARLTKAGAALTPFEDYFVVAFKKEAAAKGQLRVLEAAIELGRRLVGARFSIVGGEAARPDVSMASVLAGGLCGEDGRVDRRELDAAVASAVPVETDRSFVMDAVRAAEAGDFGFVALTRGPEKKSYGEWKRIERERAERRLTMVAIEPPKRRPDPVWTAIAPE